MFKLLVNKINSKKLSSKTYEEKLTNIVTDINKNSYLLVNQIILKM